MDIGKRIKFYRTEKKVKQEELADYLGVSIQAVSKWETGNSVPDISLLPQISVYFGITIDELFKMPNEAQFERIENMFWSVRKLDHDTFSYFERFLLDVLNSEPKNVRAMEDLAYLYNHYAHSYHEMASEYAKNVLDLEPENKAGWVAYLEANNGVCGDEWYDNHFEVIRFFKEFLEKNPKNFRGLYAIIENLLADERYDEALPYIEQIREEKKNHQYKIYLGDVAFGKGDVEKAIRLWDEAVKENPDIWQAYCSRGERLKKLSRYEDALLDFQKCYEMQDAPRISDGLYSMAQIHELLGDYKAAIQDHKAIIQNLKEDYATTDGEQVEAQLREIERLKKM